MIRLLSIWFSGNRMLWGNSQVNRRCKALHNSPFHSQPWLRICTLRAHAWKITSLFHPGSSRGFGPRNFPGLSRYSARGGWRSPNLSRRIVSRFSWRRAWNSVPCSLPNWRRGVIFACLAKAKNSIWGLCFAQFSGDGLRLQQTKFFHQPSEIFHGFAMCTLFILQLSLILWNRD